MKDKPRFDIPYPQMWIDSNCPENLVCHTDPRFSAREVDMHTVHHIEDNDGYYRYLYKYGFMVNMKGDVKKYVKSQIGSLENPLLQIQQVLYRSTQSDIRFHVETSAIRGTNRDRFLMSEYTGSRFNVGNIVAFPCNLRDTQGHIQTNISNSAESDSEVWTMERIIASGSEYFQVTYTGEHGYYSVAQPFNLPDMYTDLLAYLNSEDEPIEKGPFVLPSELDFVVEMKTC